MFAGTKVGWFLPLGLIIALSFLFVSCLSNTSALVSQPHVWHSSRISAVLSPPTIRALEQDQQFQTSLLSLTDAIAEASANLGERLQFEDLKAFGANLTTGVARLRTVRRDLEQKRGIIDDIGSAFSGILGGGGKGGGLNLTGGLSSLLGGVGSSVVGSLATPALFLGIGLGMGASDGLNLTDTATSKKQAAQVATMYNASATGVNLVAQNLGSGLSGQVVPAVMSGGGPKIAFGPVAYALASGVGKTAAYGLKLTQDKPMPSNGSDFEAIASNLGIGVTDPIVSNLNVQGLLSGSGASGLMSQLPKIAAAAGQGLGEGAKDGLGFSKNPASRMIKRDQPPKSGDMMSQLDIPGTVSSFTKGLSQSFLTDLDFNKLNPLKATNLTGSFDLMKMLRPLAAGAGAGAGMGAAIGFGLKSPDAQPTFGGHVAADDMNTAMISEGFVSNLLSNLLANSSALEKGMQYLASSSPGLLKNVNGAKAAEGLARGAVEGISSAMSSVGGIEKLISGKIPADAMENVPVLDQSKFDDSVGGAAIGLARGFTGPGTILVAQVIRNVTGIGSDNSSPPSPSNSTQKSALQIRGPKPASHESGVVSLARRQSDGSSTNSSQPAIAIDGATIQLGAQKAIDVLTCRGIGGLAAAGLGILEGSKMKGSLLDLASGSGAMLDPRALQSLPPGPIDVSSDGNRYRVVVKDMNIEINGLPVRKWGIMTAFHILFSGLAFLVFLPLYLIWGHVWRFSVLSSYPVNETANRKWRLGFMVSFSLLAFIGIILGMAGTGNARHFRDAHGVLGLICFLFLFPTFGFAVARLRSTLPHPPSMFFSLPKGPVALAKSPQRIYLISSTFTYLLILLGQFSSLVGFSTLSSISLCVADVILTPAVTANLTSIILLLHISATALLFMRMWLEEHIAKLDASRTGRKARASSIQTFGFENKESAPNPQTYKKPSFSQPKEDEILGFGDNGISTPYNVRKEGNEVARRQTGSRWYNPKTAGYLQDDNNKRPKKEGVTERDLFPSPEPIGHAMGDDNDRWPSSKNMPRRGA